jgi:hypothetical protein
LCKMMIWRLLQGFHSVADERAEFALVNVRSGSLARQSVLNKGARPCYLPGDHRF